MIHFVFGGSASGKSLFAENLLENCTQKIYLATLDKNSGGDTFERIEKHRKMRSKKNFMTVEMPLADFLIFQKDFFKNSSVLLEDLGNLVANEIFSNFDIECDYSSKIFSFIKELAQISKKLVIVSNDIFLEKIDFSDSEMKKYFQILSELNSKISEISEKRSRIVAGIEIVF